MLHAPLLRCAFARLAVCLMVFAGLHAIAMPSAAHGERRFIEVSASKASPCHHHGTTICHSCPGHICLELHGLFDQGSVPPALSLLSNIGIIEPWPAADAWAPPLTAPPAKSLLHHAARPRAPPLGT